MAPKNKKQKGDKRTKTMKKYEFNEHEVEPEEDEHDEEEDEKAGGSAAKTQEPTQKEDNELRIEDVLRWGGTQADYVMLAHLNEDNENELVDGGKKGAIDDLEDGELEKFIAKIGIRSYAAQQIVPDEPEEPGGGASQDTAQTEGQSSTDANQKESKKAKAKKDPEASKDGAQEANDKKTKKNARKNAKQSASVFEFQPRQFLLVKPGGKWYDFEYSSESTDSSAPPQDASVVNQYKALAQQLFEAEAELYKTRKSMQKGANTAWMKSVVSTGTLPDRMAAMTVLIQDAPVHTLEHVESLVGMVTKKASRRMGMMALDTLQELLLSDLLPENRKLRPFAQRPFDRLEEMASGNRDSRDRRLVLWYFEDRLKRHMAEFVTALDGVARDTVAANKAKALATAHRLLCSRPEQERALLIQVVNKVGDPETQNAAKASYLLETLLHEHPNMKGVVCSEVERLVFRPNISPKAQYYAICFLNQVLLSHEEAELATKLISMYFSFFRACVKNKDVNSKMLGALLTGVNRAYPYTKAGDDKVKEQLDTLFKVVHMVRFNTAVQALMLLFQAMDAQQTISDRYYVALYRKLLDPGLCVSSRQSMFLNLLYKSMKADIVLRRVKAFVKRLLQVSQEQNATFACGALFLVSEVMRNKPGLRLLLQDNNTDIEEEVFKDAADAEDDDGEERFVDADKVEEGQSAERPAEAPRPAASWVHHQNLEGKKLETYDPLHRNPLYCGADRSTLWELHRLSAHYHPSVSLFAKTIIQGELIQYSGDPLQDFTVIRFLDRFVFRNPKQVKGKQNTDTTVMQPKQKITLNNVRSLPVNCEAFLSKDESQIPVDEIFFHRFFKKQEKEKQKRRPKRQEDEESVEDVDDDEFERILDSAEGDDLFIDLPVDDLDFAGDVKSSKGKKKQGSEADSDDSDVDMDEDLDDEEVSLGSMDEEDFGDELEEEGGTFMGPEGNDDDDDDDDDEIPELDEDDGGFDESDIEEEPELPSRSKKTKRKITEDLDFSGSIGSKLEKKNKLKKAKKDDVTMFASAEEFGTMLDENAGSMFDSTGMNAMANTDKAGVKQLKWEAQRDDWVHGRDVKTLRRKKSSFNKRKMTAMFGQAKAKGRTFKKKK